MIQRIQQKHQFGCAVATVAMLMGIDYDAALALFPSDPDTNRGFAKFIVENILVEQGYAIGLMYKYRPGFDNTLREIWPPLPWAKMHWCEVTTSHGAHAVVMLEMALCWILIAYIVRVSPISIIQQ